MVRAVRVWRAATRRALQSPCRWIVFGTARKDTLAPDVTTVGAEVAGRAKWRQQRDVVHTLRGGGIALMLAASAAWANAAQAADDGWFISLGVFSTPAAADRAAAAYGRAADSAPRVLAIDRDGRMLHRVVVGPHDRGQSLRGALRVWRTRAPGAFALQIGAGTGAADSPSARMAMAEPARIDATDGVPAETGGDAAEAVVIRTAEPAVRVEPEAAGRATAPAEPAIDPMAGLRLDASMELLLRDDAALQRELQRLSRGLPRGLGNEIRAAEAQGVSLREARARMEAGPQSPTAAPAGYQLHRLRRAEADQGGEAAGEETGEQSGE